MTLRRPERWRARQRYWRERRCSGADVAKALALGGPGYLLVGSDGGVFTFGTTRFCGSLPGDRQTRARHPGLPPSSTGRGYILVGADGGAFNFGTGAKFHGPLPGKGVKVSDIVGIALTPDNGGYYMAGTDGHAYGFGDAHPFGEPPAIRRPLRR